MQELLKYAENALLIGVLGEFISGMPDSTSGDVGRSGTARRIMEGDFYQKLPVRLAYSILKELLEARKKIEFYSSVGKCYECGEKNTLITNLRMKLQFHEKERSLLRETLAKEKAKSLWQKVFG